MFSCAPGVMHRTYVQYIYTTYPCHFSYQSPCCALSPPPPIVSWIRPVILPYIANHHRISVGAVNIHDTRVTVSLRRPRYIFVGGYLFWV